MAKLTVMTPSYNRAYKLGDCYQSLCQQTCKDFVWMVIDDGSTDNTNELISSWQQENQITILYLKKSNGGKASALNIGLSNLSTEFAVCLDSDDTFYPQTVELALQQLEGISDDSKCCGLLALRHNEDGTVKGKRGIPSSYATITANDIFAHLKLRTELICFYKTSVLCQYRFPEFPGEKFVSPAWMQYVVSEKYYYKTSWEKLCCCEYIADGLTKNKRQVILKNPRGYTAVKWYSFKNAISLRALLRHGIMYNCGCIISKDPNWLKNSPRKVWSVILWPMAYILYCNRYRGNR